VENSAQVVENSREAVKRLWNSWGKANKKIRVVKKSVLALSIGLAVGLIHLANN
jgi:hypothetical protein